MKKLISFFGLLFITTAVFAQSLAHRRNIDRKYICSLFYFLLFKSAKMCQTCL